MTRIIYQNLILQTDLPLLPTIPTIQMPVLSSLISITTSNHCLSLLIMPSLQSSPLLENSSTVPSLLPRNYHHPPHRDRVLTCRKSPNSSLPLRRKLVTISHSIEGEPLDPMKLLHPPRLKPENRQLPPIMLLKTSHFLLVRVRRLTRLELPAI